MATPSILSCHNTTGEDDFLLVVVARDLDDYSAFVDSTLRRLPGVTSSRSNLSLKELKSSNKLPVKHGGAWGVLPWGVAAPGAGLAGKTLIKR
jgi:hypothetical protein